MAATAGGPARAPPATERAHAAFDSQGVRTRQRDMADIAVAVIGVVDLAGPSVRAGRLHAAEQRKSDHRTSGEGGVGIPVIEMRFSGGGVDRVLQPDHDSANSAPA